MKRKCQHVIEIVPAEEWHIASIAARMRKADADEVHAASGSTPLEALTLSFKKSSLVMTALVDGQPEVMWGAGEINILNGIAAPWLLGTDAVERHYVRFLRASLEWRAKLLERYTILRNFVDDRNAVSIRWLKWLGFRLLDPVEMNGHAFRLFELRSADVRFDDGARSRLDADGRCGPDTAGTGAGGGEPVQRQSRGHECDDLGASGEGRA